MELKGKCKEYFEKWYINLAKKNGASVFDYSIIKGFYSMLFSMQYGVYVDFFDSIDIHICSSPVLPIGVYGYSFSINLENNYTIYLTRNEARESAIMRANDVYNEKLVEG